MFILILVTDVEVTSKNCTPGIRVRRGSDWKWENADYHNGKPGLGNITDCNPAIGNLWAMVKWDNGQKYQYRIGDNGTYELYLANEPRK